MSVQAPESSKVGTLRKEGEAKMTLSDRLINYVVQPVALPVMEKGFIPDSVMRFGIRKLLKSTLNMVTFDGDAEKQQDYLEAFIENIKTRNIAEQTGAANEQHYEVPTDFYLLMLGPYLKYSSGYWPSDDCTLEESEEAMLRMFCERAGLETLPNKSTVLDLGCGWGSLTVYAAKKYPNLQFTSVSNSNTQREFIQQRCKDIGLENVTVKTCDINDLSFPPESFDRVMSVEMFEHMKNYEKLFFNISTWLKNDGKLMVHIFCHDKFAYHFEEGWMSDRFFSGGTMPSKDLFLRFNEHLRVDKQWVVNGKHYSKTLEAWLKRLDEKENKATILKQFGEVYGEDQAVKQLNEWRVFCLACSELFAFNNGNEWYVCHYLFSKAGNARASLSN